MSDRDALTAAICEHPDEDTPRLVFADYLDECGEAAYAAFVRAQVELARTPAWEPFAARCRWQTPGMFTGAAFAPALPAVDGFHLAWAERPFRRGFGWWLLVRTLSEWTARVAPLFARTPVGKVSFWTGVLDDWGKLAASGCVKHLREVAFVGSPIEPLFALRDLPAAAGVTDLHFERASGAGMPEVVEDLFRSRLGAAVRGLHFHVGSYGSLAPLLGALNTGGPLARLSFRVMGLSVEHVRRLFDGPAAAALAELHFRDELLGGDGLRALADLLPPTLLDLTLSNVGVRADGLEAFVRSDRLANLRRLSLSRNPLTPRAVKVLAQSRALAGLRALDVSECRIGDKGVRHLTQAKWWPNLTEIDLRNNPVSRAGVKHLLDAPVPPDLAALVLDADAAGGDGRAALAQKFGAAAVFAAPDGM